MRFRDERAVWSDLRATRHAPPGGAGANPERRSTYVAALQQAEELFRATETSGPASSPLLLFYGLSQAGRALTAAATVSRTGFDGDIETWEEHQRCRHRRSTTMSCVSVRPGWRPRPAGIRRPRSERSVGSPASSGFTLRRCARG
ncbi:YaaC family protein [Micromonospora sp. GCM10011541]|uniref:YaaC family protein n=1 Tax=Micromonospora sp. GCM10011541 TaxID=3317336 RepID=UPI00360C3B82